MFEERRREPREALILPVKLADGVSAVTRDLSPSGMYLQVQGELGDLAGTLIFEMYAYEARMRFTSEGRIIRIDRHDGITGVAVQLLSPRLHVLD